MWFDFALPVLLSPPNKIRLPNFASDPRIDHARVDPDRP